MPTLYQGSYGAGLGSAVGRGASEAINEGLNFLAQKKMMNMQQKHIAQGYEPLFGAEGAAALSRLSPDERKVLLQNPGAIQQLFGSSVQQAMPQTQQQQQFGLGALQGAQAMQPQNQQVTPDQIAQLLNPFSPKKLSEFIGKRPNVTEQEQLANQEKIAQAAQEQPKIRPIPQQPQAKNLRLPPTPEEKAKLIAEAFTSPQEKRARRELELKEEKAVREEKNLAMKETKEYVDTVLKQAKGAKENDLRLNRMEKLISKGNLPNANWWSFLSKIEDMGTLSTGGVGALIGGSIGSVVPGAGTAVGAGIGSAIGGLVGSMAAPIASVAKSWSKSATPDIEEFEKLSADFVKNAKQFFGSRLTDADLRAYMQTIPNLTQTDAGKKKIIENLRSINNMAEIEAKALRDVLKANNGNRPIDLEQQVQDRISDEIDRLAQQFIIA